MPAPQAAPPPAPGAQARQRRGSGAAAGPAARLELVVLLLRALRRRPPARPTRPAPARAPRATRAPAWASAPPAGAPAAPWARRPWRPWAAWPRRRPAAAARPPPPARRRRAPWARRGATAGFTARLRLRRGGAIRFRTGRPGPAACAADPVARVAGSLCMPAQEEHCREGLLYGAPTSASLTPYSGHALFFELCPTCAPPRPPSQRLGGRHRAAWRSAPHGAPHAPAGPHRRGGSALHQHSSLGRLGAAAWRAAARHPRWVT
jgi:hypothetical protein